jgi:predicted TIM-barrel fold metal-dependent hydrolase
MKTKTGIVVLFALMMASCGQYYSMDDFSQVDKIDAHFHVYTSNSVAMEQANKDNFRLLAINTHSGSCERVVDAHQWLSTLQKQYPESFAYTTTFCLDAWDSPAWNDNTISWLKQTINDGASSVKVWKNIGMEFRDENGELVMIDDPQFKSVFEFIAASDVPLVGHLGEPKACWQPVEEMQASNNRNYFTQNPQYHMYLHPEMPSYEEQMQARDRMLDNNPELVFIGCHLASLEWSVDVLAEWLDKYPNTAVDMAARMGDLFYQTRDDREKVRNFFINYQDRLIYGTDIIERGGSPESLYNKMHETWIRDWEYLVTDNTMTSRLIEGEFRGLQLPKSVVEKVYATNAKRLYKSFQE